MKTIGFNEMGRRYHRGASDVGDRLTRREAAAAVTAMQRAKDKPGDRIYKPLKPPPTKFTPRVTRAAEVEAARYNATIRGPEIALEFLARTPGVRTYGGR